MTNSHSKMVRAVPFLFVFLWSTGFIGAKYALPFIEPFTLLFFRMGMTIGVFFLLCLWFRSPWPSAREAGQQMVTGALVHGAYLGGVFAAIKWGMPGGITSIVVGIQPLLTAGLGWCGLGEKLSLRQWSGLTLGLIGVITVLLSSGQNPSIDFDGQALLAAIIALVGISVGTIYQKRFGSNVPLLTGSLWQYVSAFLVMAVLSFGFETQKVIWHPQLFLALGWLIFGLSVSAILLLMVMIREGEAAKVASYFYLVPPVTSIEAWLLFNETLSWIGIGAIGLAVLGVYLVTKK